MVGDWRIRSLPRCTHHVFPSHCAEDRTRLAQSIYAALESKMYFPWLDIHDYPRGRDPFAALRDGILNCRHVVYLITGPFHAQGRGWPILENAYAHLLQENFRYPSVELCAVQFPLFFLPHGHETLQRSTWAPLIHRGRFYPRGRIDRGAVNWAVDEYRCFHPAGRETGRRNSEQVEHDPSFRPLLVRNYVQQTNQVYRFHGLWRHGVALRTNRRAERVTTIMCADPPSDAQ